MKNYVVGASVIFKWVLGNERESDYEKAMDLLKTWTEGDIELSAPILWQYEVGNFLGRSLQDEAMDKMNLLLNLNLRNVALNNKALQGTSGHGGFLKSILSSKPQFNHSPVLQIPLAPELERTPQ
ncbi:MAG: hypothetical protein U9R17_02530 [Thermodesulfobacteriota bacterium]|nr:hypothetical protein [Thermodesulfobacteriota bacterium]